MTTAEVRIFFIRDPVKCPDLIRIHKRHPRPNLRSPMAMWNDGSRIAGRPELGRRRAEDAIRRTHTAPAMTAAAD